ncbi:MAG: deoxyhypusine synthase [candidate division Zixibacteria bacterium RBG_16_50_21]|nr:MAG: deoxyhypusine synthase [candidate division Zixibacteria bacterium RBG_16_50_21]
MSDYLAQPTVPLEIDPKDNVAGLLEKMGKTSFQSRNLSTAMSIWQDMLQDKVLIFLGLAGAMSAAGMRRVVSYLIENRMVDCVVSTGANLFHDMHESLGRFHFIGHHQVNDVELQERGIDRIYDTYAKEREFRNLDHMMGEFSQTLDLKRPYSTREFFHLLGKKIWSVGKQKGIVTSAYRAGIPIYCPAVADSSVGIAIATKNSKTNREFIFNVVQDVQETAYLVAESPNAAIIAVGGGTPKNFIQQAEVTASIHLGIEATGYKYCIQITTDAPHWGGLSGCTFQESQSWGKINKKARMVAVYADATIALPILATAVAQSLKGKIKKRKRPSFVMGQGLKVKW